MLELILKSSNRMSRNAKEWLSTNHIEFTERNILKNPLTREEVVDLAKSLDLDLDELIAKRSNYYKELNLNVNDLSTNEMFELLSEYPELLKVPLAKDGKKILVGFSPEEYTTFLDRDRKKLHRQFLLASSMR